MGISATKTDIANMALDHNKCENIADIDDSSKEAKVCKRWYPKAKEYLQEKHPFGFLERRVTLALIPSTTFDPADFSQYTYAYAYPGDCLVAEKIYNSSSQYAKDEIPFILMTNASNDVIYIVTDQVDACLIYTASSESFNNMRAMTFQLAFSYTLAWLTCPQLTGDSALEEKLLNRAFGITGEAKTKDSKENKEDDEYFDEYSDAMVF